VGFNLLSNRQEFRAPSNGAFAAPPNRLPLGGARGILDIEAFNLALLKERTRSDRSGEPFALILIDLEKLAVGSSVPSDPIAALRHRLRIIDEIGWFDSQRIGIFLPCTSMRGANVVVEVIAKVLDATVSLETAFSTHVYPTSEAAATPRAPHPPEERRGRDHGTPNGTAPRGRHAAFEDDGRAQPSSDPRCVSADEVGQTSSLSDNRAVAAEFYGAIETVFARDLPVWKRALDILGASICLILLSPVMLAAAIAIKLGSPGPVFFRQQRAGQGGRPFSMYKFRSMYVDAEQRRKELLARNEQSGPIFKIKSDPRITRVGRILRSSSIDELPQLWNVLIGDMTLVGPRPPTCYEIVEYQAWQRRRLEVTPGITCLWQVLGRSTIPFVTWVRLDVRYIMNRSFWSDVGLLLKTIPAVLSRRGAH